MLVENGCMRGVRVEKCIASQIHSKELKLMKGENEKE